MVSNKATDQNNSVQQLDLVRHNRHRLMAPTVTILPCIVAAALFYFSGSYFYIAVIVAFLGVGIFEYYLFESRAVPARVRFDSEGFVVKRRRKGEEERLSYADIQRLHEARATLLSRQRVEIHFKNGTKPVCLYAHAMRIDSLNGDTDAARIWDGIAISTMRWDRPVRLAREILLDKANLRPAV